MIRVELINGDQRGWFVQNSRWLTVILGAVAGSVLLYYLAVKNDLLADFSSSEPSLGQAVSHPVKNEVKDDRESLDNPENLTSATVEVEDYREADAVHASVDTVHVSTQHESFIDRIDLATAAAPMSSQGGTMA